MPTPHPECIQNYCEIVDQVYASRPDLKNQTHQNPDEVWFSDGSSFVRERVHYPRYATVSQHAVIEAQALPPGT